MPTRPLSDEARQRYKNAIEEALRDGYDPYRAKQKLGKGSAVRRAIFLLQEQGFEANDNKINRFIKSEETRAKRGEENYIPDWRLFAPPGLAVNQTKSRGTIRRWILTAAQDDTDVHQRFWANLHAFANTIGAQVSVSGFTYQTMRHTDRETLTNVYRRELRDYLRFDPMECGPVLWCAEMNILPTAAKPLSGMDAYSRGKDAVFPHAKSQMITVAQAVGDHVPALMTTGACTVPNYIPKKAGQKARFHHTLGAVLVEANSEGESWMHQIHATPDGSFQVHDTAVVDGLVTKHNRIEAIVHGDIHIPYIAKELMGSIWGSHSESLIDVLRPKFQFIHDLFDFRAYSRHSDGDHFHHVQMDVEGQLSVPKHIEEGVNFLTRDVYREFCHTVLVKSNHDARFDRWAKNNLPPNTDIENSIFWHEARVAYLRAIKDGDEDFDLVLWAMKQFSNILTERVSFIPYGGSFQICQDSGGIECGWHGDLGPNGAAPSPTAYAKMAKRIIRGHSHSPSTLDGLLTVGMLGLLYQGYNKGPSSWKHSSALIYPNGKRSHVFFTADGRWRA